ncbi:hypothetical protein ACGF4C_30460 [Streptomyces sp. NPDC048197]|uniref:hypothetical protein n=1 Tax=Streptomyces sp. NPDC048197 TaxID=3365511 RepID=UPI0037200B78
MTPPHRSSAPPAHSVGEVDLDQWRAACERSEVRRRALVRAMARIRRARLVEAQLARLLGETPGPRLVDDVAERVREMCEELDLAHDNADEYAVMWANASVRSELRRRALARAVARLHRSRRPALDQTDA